MNRSQETLDVASSLRFACDLHIAGDRPVEGSHPRQRDSGTDVTWGRMKSALVQTYADVDRNHTLQMAAALSYYFVMSLFPLLILLSSALAYISMPDLFQQAIDLMGRFMPPDTVSVILVVLADTITPNRGALLSFGIVGTLWTASGGVAAAIEALNIAYDAGETRPFWKTRPLAMGLTMALGLLLMGALGVMIVGPRFGIWLSRSLHLSSTWLWVWPVFHWTIAVGFTVLAVELLYFLAPNVKQRFTATLPGAVLSVGSWILMSYLLGIYFRHFANFNKIYGTLGAGIALMVWLYWTGFTMLVGAELNAELAKRTEAGPVEEKPAPEVSKAA